MTAKEIYMYEINTDKLYKTTIREFIDWLKESGEYSWFMNALEEYKCGGDVGMYDIATTYNVPITMVKYFLKAA